MKRGNSFHVSEFVYNGIRTKIPRSLDGHSLKSKTIRSLNLFPLGLSALALAVLGQTQWIQREKPLTVLTGFLFFSAAVFLFERLFHKNGPSAPAGGFILEGARERLFFFLILFLAFFLRIYRIGEFPAGMFTDQSSECLNVLRILREGWRPSFSDLFQQPVCVPSVYGYLLFWFKFFPATQVSFFLASVVMSLAAFPFLYRIFRHLSGSTTALFAVFFLAVMRWHITYSRDGHPAIEIPFYMALSLAFWLYSVKHRKTWAFALTGVFLAASLYSYQVSKAFVVLMAVYAAYEWLRNSKFRNRFLGQLALLFSICGTLCFPLLREMTSQQSLGWREKELMAFPGVYVHGGLRGIWEHFLGTVFSFNRWGDVWYYHNIPGHRLLDDGMGILLVLGFFHALFRIRERASFYAVTGLAVMCLPAFLSVNPNHASRLFGTIPFIVLLCGSFLSRLITTLGASKSGRKGSVFLLVVFLIFCAGQNFRDYFHEQAVQEDCWRVGNGAEASWIGKAIARDGDTCSYLICSHFYGQYTVQFLGFDHRDAMYPLRLPESLDLNFLPKEKCICLVFEEGQTGILGLFQELYPGGDVQTLKTPSGASVAYLYRLSRLVLEKAFPVEKILPRNFGLEGRYQVLDGKGRTVTFSHLDPLLNFTFRNDFSITHFPPLLARWDGWLLCPQEGPYLFLELGNDPSELLIDGKWILQEENKISEKVYLHKGFHRLQAALRKTSGVDTSFTLLWKKKGDGKFQVIPAESLRRSRPR